MASVSSEANLSPKGKLDLSPIVAQHSGKGFNMSDLDSDSVTSNLKDDFLSSGDDSVSLSAEIDAALAQVGSAIDGGGGGVLGSARAATPGSTTTRRGPLTMADLALKPENAIRESGVQSIENQLEKQRFDSQLQLERERKVSQEAMLSLKQDMDRKLLAHYDASKDLTSLKKALGDLKLSERNYDELKSRKEEALSMREYVLVKVYEQKKGLQQRLELAEKSKDDAISENMHLKVKLERMEADLNRKTLAHEGLSQDYECLKNETAARIAKLSEELRELSLNRHEVDQKSKTIAAIETNSKRTEDDLKEAKFSLDKAQDQVSSLQQENLRLREQMSHLDAKSSVLMQGELGLNRQVHLLESQNEKLTQELDQIKSKLEEVKEKKRDLVKKVEAQHTKDTFNIQERIDTEVERLKNNMDMDVSHLRTNLLELHDKERTFLQDRVEQISNERDKLAAKAMDDEQRIQELQLELSTVQQRLTNEIVELRGVNRLKQFETEKYSLSYEETLKQLTERSNDNDLLKQKVDLLRKEYYELEVRLKNEHAQTNAENISLREQLKSYLDMENELNSAIRDIGSNLDETHTSAPKTVEEAVLLGTTLAGAPSHSRRRIQENLVLAQQLQRKSRECANLKVELESRENSIAEMNKKIQVAEQSAQWRDEPRHYLIENLRVKEQEILDLKRGSQIMEREYNELQNKFIDLQESSREMESDLKSILTQREQLEFLKQKTSEITEGALQYKIQRRSGVQKHLQAKVGWLDNLQTRSSQ